MSRNFDTEFIEGLIQQSLNNTISPEDHKLLMLFFKYANKQVVDDLILKTFKQEKSTLVKYEGNVDQIIKRFQGPKTTIRSKIYSFMRYAAIVVLFLSLPLFFYKTEIRDALENAYIHTIKNTNDLSLMVIPKVTKEANMVRLSFDPARAKEYDLTTRHSEVILEDLGVRVVQQDNSIVYLPTDGSSDHLPVYHEISVPYGRTFDVQLLDGTKIKLNSGSTLRYPLRIDSGKMLLTLRGEGYFDVAKMDDRKFIVEIPGRGLSKQYQIEVLGTEFNIKAYEADSESQATLFTGAIQAHIAGEQTVGLQPSQQLSVSHEVFVSDANIMAARAWMNHVFYFENAGLDQLCREISRWYNTEIVYDRTLEDLKFYVNISKDKSLNEVLDILRQHNEIKIRLTKDKVTITRQK